MIKVSVTKENQPPAFVPVVVSITFDCPRKLSVFTSLLNTTPVCDLLNNLGGLSTQECIAITSAISKNTGFSTGEFVDKIAAKVSY